MSDGSGRPTPPEVVTGRDVELVVVGLVCFAIAGWTGLGAGLAPVAILAGLGVLSFALAIWDLGTRDASIAARLERRLSR